MGQGLLKYPMETRNILGGKRVGVQRLLQSDDGHNTGMREFFSLHSHFHTRWELQEVFVPSF